MAVDIFISRLCIICVLNLLSVHVRKTELKI